MKKVIIAIILNAIGAAVMLGLVALGCVLVHLTDSLGAWIIAKM